jgi:hypothetical protein
VYINHFVCLIQQHVITLYIVDDKPQLGGKKSCKNCGREGANKQCRYVLCKKCCIVSYQKCGVSDHDTNRPTAAKPYLETLAQSTVSNVEINNNNGEGTPSATADFEHVKTMLEDAISENHSAFISYLAEKKPTAEEGGKKRRKKKKEQSVLVDTYRKIMPKKFKNGKREPGLKVIAGCGLRDGEKCEFFLHKIMRIEDYDWKGTWKSQTTSTYLLSMLSVHIYLHLCN